MTQEELQQLVEKISIESFHLPFRHRAVFNARLRSTGGRYHLSDHHLDFNLKMFKEVDEKTKIGIIKHELCHYHLHLGNKGYRHQDADFKNLLKKKTGGIRYAPRVSTNQVKKNRMLRMSKLFSTHLPQTKNKYRTLCLWKMSRKISMERNKKCSRKVMLMGEKNG